MLAGCGKKARRGFERLHRALAIEERVASDLRRMATDDIPALERALAMARHDIIACGGRHPAAQRFLEIARREGIG